MAGLSTKKPLQKMFATTSQLCLMPITISSVVPNGSRGKDSCHLRGLWREEHPQREAGFIQGRSHGTMEGDLLCSGSPGGEGMGLSICGKTGVLRERTHRGKIKTRIQGNADDMGGGSSSKVHGKASQDQG